MTMLIRKKFLGALGHMPTIIDAAENYDLRHNTAQIFEVGLAINLATLNVVRRVPPKAFIQEYADHFIMLPEKRRIKVEGVASPVKEQFFPHERTGSLLHPGHLTLL